MWESSLLECCLIFMLNTVADIEVLTDIVAQKEKKFLALDQNKKSIY